MMNTHADKTQNNKSQSVANTVAQKKSGTGSVFQFVDKRTGAIAQRKLQEIANNNRQAMQLRSFQDLADNSPQTKQAAQLQAIANNYSAQQQPSIRKKENNTGLPDNLKLGVENLSGYSMDDVKVHYNSDKPAQLQAHAYAQGTDIHIASGQEKHLPHEAWHVVQQKQGRVKPTMQLKGKVNINDDAGLEKEADVMGRKALSVTQRAKKGGLSTKITQFKGGYVFDIGITSHKSIVAQRSEVVQRIIVMADTQVDFGMIVNVYQMLSNGIDGRVTMLSILNKSNLSDEQIGLEGHGNENSFAGIPAKELAEYLKKCGVDDTNTVIDILACEVGKGNYANEFATAMKNSATVVANKGLGVVMDDGYTYSKRDRTTKEQSEYDGIKQSCIDQIKSAEKITNEAKIKINEVVSNPNLSGIESENLIKEIFIKYGKLILGVAGNLFQQLYQHQAKLLAAHDDIDRGLNIIERI